MQLCETFERPLKERLTVNTLHVVEEISLLRGHFSSRWLTVLSIVLEINKTDGNV